MSDTGSLSSILVDNSGFSTFLCVLSVTEPSPISPEQVNLTPSLVASIETIQKKKKEELFQHRDSPKKCEVGVRVQFISKTYLIPITGSNRDKSSETRLRAM